MPADLRASTVDDARQFFRAFYHPANASLAIAGDVDPEAALALAERYFGPIPAGPPVTHPRVGAALGAPVRLVLDDRVELPRLSLAWHTPAMFHDDDAQLDLAADVLANGKSSRLYKVLVYDTRLAADVSAMQASREMSSVFHVAATAAPGRTLGELAAAIERTLDELAAHGPTADELERALARTEAQFVYRVQTIAGSPGSIHDDRARYARATSASVASAVTRWLREAPGVALSVVPHGQRALALDGAVEARPA
jgi:zinc protease